MPRGVRSAPDKNLLLAALEGLEAQRQRIQEQISQVQGMLGRRGKAAPAAAVDKEPGKRRTRRPLSAEARKRIAAAQKRRWAEYRKKTA